VKPFELAAIATLKEYRGQKLSRSYLSTQLEEIGREKGCKKAIPFILTKRLLLFYEELDIESCPMNSTKITFPWWFF